jgi:starch-binding outer membrane protein, SusD/RagB family
MKLNKFIIAVLVVLSVASCKKQLDVKNPNQPTPSSASNEAGILSLAQGGIYINGFFDLKYSDGVYGRFWPGAMGFHELMADIIGAEAANAYMNQIGCPDKVILDNGTAVLNPGNPNKQYSLLRFVNNNSLQGSNTTFYEWAYMYNLIVATNNILELSNTVKFSGDVATKKAAVQAWAYFWKGFAYSRIGSTYYAGLIQNAGSGTNGNYVTKEAIITESNANFDKAAALLTPLTANADYTAVVNRLIPDYCRTGRGGTITPAMWVHNINTMKARNILVNNTVATITPAKWNDIITLANNGVASGDLIFTGRSNANGDFLGTGTSVADKTSSNLAGENTYKLSERFVLDFKAGDKRYTQNIKQTAVWLGNSDRGNAFNSRFALVNGGTGIAGTKVYANGTVGANEISLTATYEENQLMLAEAKIYTGNIDAGLTNLDNVRTYQGAGLTAVSGTGLTQAQAVTELRKERRVALAFLGLSFYDARRWGVIDPIANGGGRTGTTVISASGAVNTNASIEYGFLDYWDVPDNELAYNPPAGGSTPTKNPKQ